MLLHPKISHEQMAALHVYYRAIAEALNFHSLSVQAALKVEVDWNEHNVVLFIDELKGLGYEGDPKFLAETLNELGMTLQKTIKTPLRWSETRFKELVGKPVMHMLYPEISSHKDLQSDQVELLYDTINRATGQRYGITCSFPTKKNTFPTSKGDK